MIPPIGFGRFNPWYAGLESFGAPSGPVTLIYDSFTEASNTLITDHTPDTVVAPASGGYSENFAVTFRVDASGVLESDGPASNGRMCWISSGISGGIFSLGGVVASAGLVFRLTDASNYWLAFNSPAAGGSILLYEVTAGAFTTRGSYSTGGVAERKLQAICDGTSHTIYVDGVSRITFTSSVHETSVNVGAYAQGTGTIPAGNKIADELYVVDSTNAADLP